MTNRTELNKPSFDEIEPTKSIELSYTAIYGDKDGKLTNFYLRLKKGKGQVFVEFNIRSQSLVLWKGKTGEVDREEILKINFTTDQRPDQTSDQTPEVFFNRESLQTKDGIYSISFPLGGDNFVFIYPRPKELRELIQKLGESSLGKIPLHPIDEKRTNFLPLMPEEIKELLQKYGFDFSLIDIDGRKILSFKDSLSDNRG